MKYKKEMLVLGAIIIVAILLTFGSNKFNTNKEKVIQSNTVTATGKSVSSQAKVVLLSAEERTKIIQILTTSAFAKDVPAKSPIALTFFSFENGQRIWRDSFLISEGKLLSSGTPAVSLTIHSKYISELNANNLCEIVKKANQNRDLGFQSEYSKTKLLLKYAGMLKHRECFGF